jgi:hypothetical protein
MSLAITWTDADGVDHDLYDWAGWTVTEGAVGLEGPPMTNTIAPFVGLDGGALIKRRRPVRSIVLPIHVTHPTRAMTQIATVVKALQGPGILTLADGTTTRSLLDVYYEAGLEGYRARSQGSAGLSRRFVVSLVALNPWWHDAQQSEDVDTGAVAFDDASTGFDAAIDFDGRATTAFAVDGDTTALPTWTIDGPYTKLIVGTQGGQLFELADALADGDRIVVDTRPGNRGPRLNDGNIDWSLLTPASRLWELPTGTPVVVAAASGDDAGSGVSVAFRQRWLTP